VKGTIPAGVLRAFMDESPVGVDSSAEESTTSALRKAILGGVLEPGDRLRQEVLAAELGVSRIPLRDAFRRLEAEGLIHIDGRRGARVASLSLEEVAELYEVRRLLEVHLVRLAIKNLTDEGASALVELGEHMDISAGHVAPGGVSRRGFYAEFYRWAERPRMTSLILQLRHELHRYHALKDVPPPPTIHAELRVFIKSRDAEGGARLMRDHLRVSRDALIGALRRDARTRATATRRTRRSTSAR
jgi:DNA-binding GntR family transcriptional regulator